MQSMWAKGSLFVVTNYLSFFFNFVFFLSMEKGCSRINFLFALWSVHSSLSSLTLLLFSWCNFFLVFLLFGEYEQTVDGHPFFSRDFHICDVEEFILYYFRIYLIKTGASYTLGRNKSISQTCWMFD